MAISWEKERVRDVLSLMSVPVPLAARGITFLL
jgi:hypothetical protein